MKLFIGGSRDGFDEDLAYEIIHTHITNSIIKHKTVEIIHGAARGIDSLADFIATEKKLHIIPIEPDWNKHGRSAGHIRNQEMINECDCGLLVWNGKSPGTKGALSMLITSGKPFVLHKI